MAGRGQDGFMQPGFLNGPGRRGGPPAPPRSSNPIARFWAEEIVHPEKLPGNMAIAYGTAIAVAGVLFIRTLGKAALVPF
ncbi:hypothetical protein BDZ90DRAFT_259827 [Jaminaea rosea]|uniref:Uncharacterized protein n=1 Tax=Jaminaea rosea TaxID=1569628 RepID=A0A316URT0_9BASI|nr:hypothetical protein BDZ90DRAFT_259827 [Jaminaea rosea]PWN27996.1 hypothetical protein BDZ90DRAFT_259827 [Jaminaea rosea]